MRERGQASVLGALFVFIILAALYVSTQVYQVPAWNREVEYSHMSTVYEDMKALKSSIEDVAMKGMPKSSNIHLGVRYPDRMIFINPGPGVSGMLVIESTPIMVTYRKGNSEFSREFNSSRIIYEANGTVKSPKLIYEHGIVIRDWGNRSITEDEQLLVVGDNIYLPILPTVEKSVSSMGLETLYIAPLEVDVVNEFDSVTTTLQTNYPEVWGELLSNVNTDKIQVSISGGQITINSSAGGGIRLPKSAAPSDKIFAFTLIAGPIAAPPPP